MSTLDSPNRLIYLNQQYVPLNTADISPFDYGFNYGFGVYDVARVEQGRIYQLQEHIERLLRNAAQIGLTPLETAEQLTQISLKLVAETVGPQELHTPSAIVYYQLSPGQYGRRNHRYPAELKPTVFIYTQRLTPLSTELYRHGLRVTLEPDDRWDHCDLKTTALCSNVWHFNACLARGFDDFIYFDKRTEHVLELSSSNLFVVLHDGTVRTPPLVDRHVLPGLTRATLLQLAAQAQVEISEGDISLAELRTAREVFVTATTKEIVPVRAVDETALPVWGPVTCRLARLLALHVEHALGLVHPRRALLDELCA